MIRTSMGFWMAKARGMLMNVTVFLMLQKVRLSMMGCMLVL
ncbi:hypothetical protein Hanom_Chr03g00263201 [Helianthus anomalus]